MVETSTLSCTEVLQGKLPDFIEQVPLAKKVKQVESVPLTELELSIQMPQVLIDRSYDVPIGVPQLPRLAEMVAGQLLFPQLD